MYYSPLTEEQRQYILNTLSLTKVEDVFKDIPTDGITSKMSVMGSLSEMQLQKELRQLSQKNKNLLDTLSFLGGGIYQHYIPSVINHLLLRSEFYTAYTPYQPEMSQGSLRAIFEFQTMICALFGLDISNASLYDGATAAAEACIMGINKSGKKKVLLPETVHPETIKVIRTYLEPKGIDVQVQSFSVFYHFNSQNFNNQINEDIGSIVLPYPDFFGNMINYEKVIDKAKSYDIPVIMTCDPMALSLFKNPGQLGADIAVAEGQCLGISPTFGGPGLGIITAKEEYTRIMPGRIAGETTDAEGNKGYVLTFQTREQHIRREKALSNICSNQGLLSLAATIYLSYMGPAGLRRVAELCYKKSEYVKRELSKIKGIKVLNPGTTFKEFIISLPESSTTFISKLKKHNILPGINITPYFKKANNVLLVCVTEVKTQSELDHFIETTKDILNEEAI